MWLVCGLSRLGLDVWLAMGGCGVSVNCFLTHMWAVRSHPTVTGVLCGARGLRQIDVCRADCTDLMAGRFYVVFYVTHILVANSQDIILDRTKCIDDLYRS